MVTSQDIVEWSQRVVGRYAFGELLRRLILATVPYDAIRTIRILDHEGSGLSGWDGMLEWESKRNHPEIPVGRSVWELKTGKNARDEIKKDFAKRIANPNLPAEWSAHDVTYVAMVGIRLDQLQDLQLEMATNPASPFKGVCILDAVSLEEWLARALNVVAWLHDEHRVGRVGPLKALSHVGKEWCEVTDPPLALGLLLAGRIREADNLLQKLRDGTPSLTVLADSPQEAEAWVAAVLSQACAVPNQEETVIWRQWLDRCVVCRDTNILDELLSQSQMLILLQDGAKVNLLKRAGHTMIITPGRQTPGGCADIILSRPLRQEFASALQLMYRPNALEMDAKTRAEIDAKACGSSASVWRIWNLLNNPISETHWPEWAKGEITSAVVGAIFAGGWDQANEADKDLLTKLCDCSGVDYQQMEGLFHRFFCCDDPLMERSGCFTMVKGSATAFALIVGRGAITPNQLQMLAEAVTTVFQETDPVIDIPPEQHWFANSDGKRLSHSGWLRDGLAETLLRIVVLGERLETNGVTLPAGQTRQEFVDRLIQSLPGLKDDWRLIASLREQLPVLMEAAPRPFLEALESLVRSHGPQVASLFHEGAEAGGFGAHPLHTGLLWGLETLAWEPEYLARVVMILAGLHAHDPGGGFSNRPMESLREIFLFWLPGTNASVSQRQDVLQALMERHPAIGWVLLVELLSPLYSFSRGTRKPRWREFGRSGRPKMTNREVRKAYDGILQLAVLHAHGDSARLTRLLDSYADLNHDHHTAILAALDAFVADSPSQDEQQTIVDALRNLIGRHTQFPDATWSLLQERFAPLRERLVRWQSENAPTRFDWLFNEWLPSLPVAVRDYEEWKVLLARHRREAVDALMNEGGWEAVKRLIRRVEEPNWVVERLEQHLGSTTEMLVVVRDLLDGHERVQNCAAGISSIILRRFGDEWLECLRQAAQRESWLPEHLALLCFYFPYSKQQLEWIAQLGPEVHRSYWRQKQLYLCGDNELDPAWVVEQFMQVDEPWTALKYVVALRLRTVLNAELALTVLEACLRGDTLAPANHSLSYQVVELFEWLRAQPRVDLQRLAALEYGYLPWLVTHFTGKEQILLHHCLASEPELFIQVVCDVFKPSSSRQKDSEEPDPARQLRATHGRDLLNSWRTPPGCVASGSLDGMATVAPADNVDGDALKMWMDQARKLAQEHDRADVADQLIGQVMFYFPSDSNDGAWPHQQLRKLLEAVASTEIEQGIAIESFNSRGVTCRGVFDGGVQERQLAEKWRGWAQTVGLRWPRTQAMLLGIAGDWVREGSSQDEYAQQKRMQDA